MNKRVKRIGCSGIKDLLEERKLSIIDEQTILEASTFVASGQSFEASEGNHDDLMMNLVMFGYYAMTEQFINMTDINIKETLYAEKMRAIEDDVVPFGFIDDGEEEIQRILTQEDFDRMGWQIYTDPDLDFL